MPKKFYITLTDEYGESFGTVSVSDLDDVEEFNERLRRIVDPEFVSRVERMVARADRNKPVHPLNLDGSADIERRVTTQFGQGGLVGAYSYYLLMYGPPEYWSVTTDRWYGTREYYATIHQQVYLKYGKIWAQIRDGEV